MTKPKLIVFCSTFPDKNQPHFGIFVKNRMFRYAKAGNDIVVISPRAWFPGQSILTKFYPHKRPPCSKFEEQDGIKVFYPRYFSLPGLFKWADGFFMALGAFQLVKKFKQEGFSIIDSHFVYPDGYAATLLGRWLKLPASITLRGTIVSKSKEPALRKRIIKAVDSADQVISVTQDLTDVARKIGCDRKAYELVGNGVDTSIFYPDRDAALDVRRSLNIPKDAKVLISVGGLIEHKGHHRVVQSMPSILQAHPNTYYLIVGGASLAGDYSAEIKADIERLELSDRVYMVGTKTPDELRGYLSAADIFTLSTRYEGWANVFLEAMACGLPVITTDVGGNPEVVASPDVGRLVPFDEHNLQLWSEALISALNLGWSETTIVDYAMNNSWDSRVALLESLFVELNAD